jgi:nucleotide-binding universal stress UspA family protein
MRTTQTILHPTDFSASARQAFDLACSLARDGRARLIVLHVLPHPVVLPGGVMMAPPPPPPVEERAAARKQLEGVRPDDPSVRVEHRLEEGDPVTAILAVAAEVSCDLIAMGTHGRSGLDRLLMGSVAEMVLRQAPCPVLTVRTPAALSKAGRA